MTIMRQIRAVSGIAVTWGVAFSALATTTLLAGIAFDAIPSRFFGAPIIAAIVLRSFVGGALAGTIFATVFARAERNRTLATLSTGRVALWGFIGAAAIPAGLMLSI